MQTKTIVVEEEGEEQPAAKSGKIIECKTRKGGRQIGGGMTGRQWVEWKNHIFLFKWVWCCLHVNMEQWLIIK